MSIDRYSIMFQFAAISAMAAAVPLAWRIGPRPAALALVIATLMTIIGVAKDFALQWPYVPIHMGIRQVIALLCLICLLHVKGAALHPKGPLPFAILALCILWLVVLFFPKDYYLPNLYSSSPWSHAFSWSYAAARALFIWAAAIAFAALIGEKAPNSPRGLYISMDSWIAGSFTLMAISIASGAMWSLNSIGVPISFHDPQSIGVLLIWTYLLLVSHASFAGYGKRTRQGLIALGGMLIVAVTIFSDIGIWRTPWH